MTPYDSRKAIQAQVGPLGGGGNYRRHRTLTRGLPGGRTASPDMSLARQITPAKSIRPIHGGVQCWSNLGVDHKVGDTQVSDIDEEYQQSRTIIDLQIEVERHWGWLEEDRYQNHVAERKASIAARKIREIPLVQVDPGFCETHINTGANRFAER